MNSGKVKWRVLSRRLRSFLFDCRQHGVMAYVLSQMPVHCSTGQLMKEPDVLPKLTCLFEKEIVHDTTENAKESIHEEPQEQNGEELMIAHCKHSETESIIKLQDNSEEKEKEEITIDIVLCEDQEMTFDTKPKANNDIETQTNSVVSEVFQINSDGQVAVNGDEDQTLDIISCEGAEEASVTSNAGAEQNNQKLREFSIPLQKLRVSTNCINKRPELEEDEYIFCNHCDKLRVGDCPVHGGLRWIKEPTAVMERDGLTRARSTIPSSMDLRISSIPDAGLGMFAKERYKADVVFGPYWGDKIDVADLTPNSDQSYMWDIIENGRVTHVVDARAEEHSNWLRFVNCARNEDEQNLVAFQFRGEIYYRSFKTIEPGMELLVWYGDKYACDLAILNKDTTRKMEDGPIQCQKCFMVCSGPVSFANHNKFRCQLNNDHHRWRCIHCDRSFKDQKSLHFHKYIHKGVKPFTCGVCERVFAFKSSKNRHQKQMHPAVTLDCRCTLCSNVFDDKNRLWVRLRLNYCP